MIHRVGELPLLTQARQRQLLMKCKDTIADYLRVELPQLFVWQAADSTGPDRPVQDAP